MSEFELQSTEVGHQLIGELTFSNAAKVLQKIPDLPVMQGSAVLDVAQLTAVDSAGLSVLLHWVRSAAQKNKSLNLINPSEQLAALISISGLSDIV